MKTKIYIVLSFVIGTIKAMITVQVGDTINKTFVIGTKNEKEDICSIKLRYRNNQSDDNSTSM